METIHVVKCQDYAIHSIFDLVYPSLSRLHQYCAKLSYSTDIMKLLIDVNHDCIVFLFSSTHLCLFITKQWVKRRKVKSASQQRYINSLVWTSLYSWISCLKDSFVHNRLHRSKLIEVDQHAPSNLRWISASTCRTNSLSIQSSLEKKKLINSYF